MATVTTRVAGAVLVIAAIVWATLTLVHDHGYVASTSASVQVSKDDWQVAALGGGSVRLRDWHGQPVALHFFASWCDPCWEEVPALRQFVDAATARGYAVIGLALLDDAAGARRFLSEAGLDLTVGLDASGAVAAGYGVRGPPATVFLDAAGVVQHTVIGPLDAEKGEAGWLAATTAGTADSAAASAGAAPRHGESFSWSALGLAAGLGILSFLSPCVLPLIPAYLAYLSGAALAASGSAPPQPRFRLVWSAIAFTIGLVAVFAALGASAAWLGSWLLQWRGWVTRVAGIVIVVFGLSQLGWLAVPLLQRDFRPGLGRVGGSERPRVWQAAFFGAAFGFGWTPCVGPMLGSMLVLASQSKTLAWGVLLLTAYGIGLGVPFVASGVLLGRLQALGRRASWLTAGLPRIAGAMLVAMGFLLAGDRLGAVSVWFGKVFGG